MDAPKPEDERTRGRALALHTLYGMDLTRGRTPDEALASVLEVERAPALAADFARVLVSGVHEHLTEIDTAIQDAAVNWQVSRMPYVDRAILRMGAFELMHMFDIPPRVSINEAVALAKEYSTEKSGAFVNGVLDKIFQTHCPQKV
jgi:transcription antitermination factor NusB